MKTPSLKILWIIMLAAPMLANAESGLRGGPDGNPPPRCDEHRPMPPEFGDKPMLPHYIKDLALSEAQEDKVFAIAHAQVPVMRDNEKQKRKALDELTGLTRASSFDEKKALQLADKLAALTKEAVLNRASTDFKIFSLLTPEQRSKAIEFKNHRPEGHDDQPINFKLPQTQGAKFIKS